MTILTDILLTMTPASPAFSALLQQARVAAGLSRGALAQRVGLDPSHVYRIETGGRRPSREAALALADALGVEGEAVNTWLVAAGYAPLPLLPRVRGAVRTRGRGRSPAITPTPSSAWDTGLWARLLPVLSWRLSLLTRRVHEHDVECYGAMVYDRAARALDRAWYEGRGKPDDGLFAAHWSRQPDQVAKIAMLLKLCDFWDFERPREDWRIIEERHWAQARALSEQLLLNAGTFLGQSLSHAHNWQMAKVEETIRGRRMIRQKPELLRIVSRYGIKARELERALQALEDEERVSRWPHGGGNYMIEWREGEGA